MQTHSNRFPAAFLEGRRGLIDIAREPRLLEIPGTPNREFLTCSPDFLDFPGETSNLKDYYLLEASKYNFWTRVLHVDKQLDFEASKK